MIFRYRPFFSDRIRLLSRLSLKRVVNYLKIITSYNLSRLMSTVLVWGGPFALHFETSAICNLRCPECIAGQGKLKRTQKLTDPEMVKEKLIEHGKTAFYSNLYFQGEPFLHPKLASIIALVHTHGLYTVISTNGHFLSRQNCRMLIESGLDRLIVSLDGPDSESYSQYRVNGDFEKVVAGIKCLVETREKMNTRHPLVVVQQLVNKTNENRLKETFALVKSTGADVLELKSMQIYTEEGRHTLAPAGEKFNRYKGKKQANEKGCFRLWSNAVFSSDGQMILCCYDKIPGYNTDGGTENKSNAWKSARMNAFRRRLLIGENLPEICQNCNR